MDALTKNELNHFAHILAERKQRLAEEIRRAAQARLAAGRYGLCIDCGEPIARQRLEAYPTAKRCLADQQRREQTRASAPHPRF